jgi:amino acid transporter
VLLAFERGLPTHRRALLRRRRRLRRGPRIQKLADSHAFTGIASLLIILFLLALNVRGLSLGKWISNLGALGTIGGAAIICLLAFMTLRHQRQRAPSCRPPS